MDSIDLQELKTKWDLLTLSLEKDFGEKPDLQALLFLIGVQELGKGPQKFSKDEKQDLMHIAICSLFRQSGYYELDRVDEDGWPHFKQLKALPVMTMPQQENFLKDHILLYFENAGI